MITYFVHQVTASKQQDFAAPPSKEEWGGDQQVMSNLCKSRIDPCFAYNILKI